MDDTYPGVPWAILPPNQPIRAGWCDPKLVNDAASIYLDAAIDLGAVVIDHRYVTTRSSYMARMDMTLTVLATELIAAMLLPWLLTTIATPNEGPCRGSPNDSATPARL